ncbi:MAG: hypothetical protein K2N15_06765 [Lachnospiraceae bacterium]|nr:hypothetical protein [Lachnospiraceae bacterium]
MQNPIAAGNLGWILHCNCEGTEQLQTALVVSVSLNAGCRQRERNLRIAQPCLKVNLLLWLYCIFLAFYYMQRFKIKILQKKDDIKDKA